MNTDQLKALEPHLFQSKEIKQKAEVLSNLDAAKLIDMLYECINYRESKERHTIF